MCARRNSAFLFQFWVKLSYVARDSRKYSRSIELRESLLRRIFILLSREGARAKWPRRSDEMARSAMARTYALACNSIPGEFLQRVCISLPVLSAQYTGSERSEITRLVYGENSAATAFTELGKVYTVERAYISNAPMCMWFRHFSRAFLLPLVCIYLAVLEAGLNVVDYTSQLPGRFAEVWVPRSRRKFDCNRTSLA